jgi:hypothetical protein
MSRLEQYAKSIAATASDYRKDEIGPFNQAHVMKWVDHFEPDDRLSVLSELDHVLKQTYFSKARVAKFLTRLVSNAKLTGGNPLKFWKSAGVLDIQQGGSSQTEILELFGPILRTEIGLDLDDCEATSGNFIYLDDAVFTGNRVLHDLGPWIENDAPEKAKVFIIVLALHELGDYYAGKAIRKTAREAGKTIRPEMRSVRRIENRKYYRNQSEVLWPATLPDDEGVAEYVQMLTDAGHPPTLRIKGGTPTKDGIFSGEEGRAGLESALLKAGVQVRSVCSMLPETARPLGYSILKTLGFGSTFVSYRNCPNNCPIAFWAGDPWYPLFRRKTN